MQKIRFILSIAITAIMLTSFHSPVKDKTKLQWLSLQQAENMNKNNRKPVLIDLYTEWCGWCKVMDKKTYSNEAVAKYINDNFYAVKIDAETKETLMWNGKSFIYNSEARINNYALYLTKGQLSFPTTVIIPADGTAPQVIPGYLEIKDMELILKYFGEGNYGKTAFADYQKKFVPAWK